jgi:hypothetical protein
MKRDRSTKESELAPPSALTTTDTVPDPSTTISYRRQFGLLVASAHRPSSWISPGRMWAIH